MMDDKVPCRLLLTLLDLPGGRQGRHGEQGVSTKVIQWILVYTIDAQVEQIIKQVNVSDIGRGRKRGRVARNDSFRQVSKYLGVSSGFYKQVKKSLLRCKPEILKAMGWKGGVEDESQQ